MIESGEYEMMRRYNGAIVYLTSFDWVVFCYIMFSGNERLFSTIYLSISYVSHFFVLFFVSVVSKACVHGRWYRWEREVTGGYCRSLGSFCCFLLYTCYTCYIYLSLEGLIPSEYLLVSSEQKFNFRPPPVLSSTVRVGSALHSPKTNPDGKVKHES